MTFDAFLKTTLAGATDWPLLIAIPLLPLISATLLGLLGSRMKKEAVSWIACGSIGLSFVASLVSVVALARLPHEARRMFAVPFEWFGTADVHVDFGFWLDPLSAVMILVVTGVGFLIHVYSIGYMGHDEGYSRYFSYLNLFSCAMLLLVLGKNMLVMFIGWEGVGLCSYLLIGYWFQDPAKAAAGKKAFIVNRIGDFAFICGGLLLFWRMAPWVTGFDFTLINQNVHHVAGTQWFGFPVLDVVGILFFVGACGKSAQIPLFVWLPDAMAGPTPVSALIHAATMVTAGVYMVARLHGLYDLAPMATLVISVVGALTAFMAATIAIAQYDIKKVLAYSTVSQLGYMFMGVGSGFYISGIFHLMTHAFFKALLFLGSGSVIHAMHEEQDIRKMGGLWHHIPTTAWTFAIGTYTIAGLPLAAAFFSKDDILWRTLNSGHGDWSAILVGFGLVTALMTAFYMGRLFWLTFGGKERFGKNLHPHESPAVMTIPLQVLAVLSIVGGWVLIPHVFEPFEHWLAPVFTPHGGHAKALTAAPSVEWLLMAVSTLLAIAGSAAAYAAYKNGLAFEDGLKRRLGMIFTFLERKWYWDEIYAYLIVEPFHGLSRAFFHAVDRRVIDRGLVEGSGRGVLAVSERFAHLQSGNLTHYLIAIVAGALFVVKTLCF